MTTSLADQLRKLSQANPLVNTLQQRSKASFLFDAKKASDLDLDTIHSIGMNGIMELKSINPRFAKYESALFSEKMKAFDRAFKSQEENKQLDVVIDEALVVMSPYFLLKPAAKALEWMIRRFRINEFNVDALMAMMLPYHETSPFLKMVSLIDLKYECLNNITYHKFILGLRRIAAGITCWNRLNQLHLTVNF